MRLNIFPFQRCNNWNRETRRLCGGN